MLLALIMMAKTENELIDDNFDNGNFELKTDSDWSLEIERMVKRTQNHSRGKDTQVLSLEDIAFFDFFPENLMNSKSSKGNLVTTGDSSDSEDHQNQNQHFEDNQNFVKLPFLIEQKTKISAKLDPKKLIQLVIYKYKNALLE